jgi:L-lactate dehydrogenase complex protein LldG
VSPREKILDRIRMQTGRRAPFHVRMDAVTDHLKAHPISARPRVEGDLRARFAEMAGRLSMTSKEVAQLEHAPAAIAAYLDQHQLPHATVCWPQFAALDWAGAGIATEARAAREPDKVGITGAFCAIAETGTLMTLSGQTTPPAVSLLVETHIAIVRASRIVPCMEEAWALLRAAHETMPRAVNFISGPSRTADIEQTLTFGAHGPYRVHVIVINE